MNSSTRGKPGKIKQMKKSTLLYKKYSTPNKNVVQPDKERLDTVSLIHCLLQMYYEKRKMYIQICLEESR